jgi:transposase
VVEAGRWAVLVELSVMEQRYQAVLAVVQDGWKVVEVADRLGVSRQTVHNWVAR